MFEVERKSDTRLDIRVSGRIDSDAMRAALDDLLAAAAGIENGDMLYTISDFEFPSAGAIAIEFSRLPDLLRLMRRFSRAAVVADAHWIRRVSELEGLLFPGLEIKAFEHAADAEQWLTASASD